MVISLRPHVLGIDDGAFEKGSPSPVPVVGVLMEGCDQVEAVARTQFAVDEPRATERLAEWIPGLRLYPSLQAVVLGGITIAGLGVVDIARLSRAIERPVLAVNRRDPAQHRLNRALRAAGLAERIQIVDATPGSFAVDALYVASCGLCAEDAAKLVRGLRRKSHVPEPLRLAHLIATAVARGESHGRA